MGTFEPWASSTILITCERKVSSPILVALTFRSPRWLIVAPITVSPGFFCTGIDSPVAIDSSTPLSPSSTMPSVGIFSPGRTINRSPLPTSSMETSTSLPSLRILAVFASNSRSRLMACDARPLAFASTYLPVRWKAIIMAATPA